MTRLVLGANQRTLTPPAPSTTARELVFIRRAENIFHKAGLNDVKVEIRIAPFITGIRANCVTYIGSIPKSKFFDGSYRSVSCRVVEIAKKYGMEVFVKEAFDSDKVILSFPDLPERIVDTIDFEL